jgi:hypothetical protein
MQPSGLAQVEAAKADGHWDAAYACGTTSRGIRSSAGPSLA